MCFLDMVSHLDERHMHDPAGPFDVVKVREDFPILKREVHGKPLVYLDNAATTQKPLAVLEAIDRLYRLENANVHRGIHQLSEEATRSYEKARVSVQRFLGAASPDEIIFVRGTTEAINLVAQTHGRRCVQAGDEIIISEMEHHSNIVPWQLLCEERGASLRVIPVDDRGDLDLEALDRLLTDRARLVSVAHVSNVLGTVNPVAEIVRRAHRRGIPVLVDGAQAVPHLEPDVRAMGCDFYAFSGHKVYGPTGIGVLYGKAASLESLPPYQGGGGMIETVTFEKTTFQKPPYKFEAGTPNVAGSLGLMAALDYIERVGRRSAIEHEQDLLRSATERIAEFPRVRILGQAREKAGVLSLALEGVDAHAAAAVLDQQGIAVRAGHQCAQPLMKRLGLTASLRASFALYNTREEVEAFARGIRRAIQILG